MCRELGVGAWTGHSPRWHRYAVPGPRRGWRARLSRGVAPLNPSLVSTGWDGSAIRGAWLMIALEGWKLSQTDLKLQSR